MYRFHPRRFEPVIERFRPVGERLKLVSERLKAGILSSWTNHRIPTIVVSVIAVVAIVGAGVLVVVTPRGGKSGASHSASASIASSSSSPSAWPTAQNSQAYVAGGSPTPLPSGWTYADLDGMPAPAAQAHALPLAIMISDNAAARPQSGISSAAIVYQAYAEGGEDRYMMVFQEGNATDIGPVRSARPDYVYWAAEYKALYAHDGGSPKALQQTIPTMANNIYDENASYGGSCPYHRITSRSAPQNEYTNSATLISCAAKRSYPATYQNLPVRPFRNDIEFAQRPSSQQISIAYRTASIGYQFNAYSNNYTRLIDGKPEIDPANNNTVFARTIVVMYQAVTLDPETDPGYQRVIIHNVGIGGKATIFMEGKQIAATWTKASNAALTRFYDASGTEIPFVRGEIFMESTPPGTEVLVK
jgi:hypothetical protein